MAYTGIIYRFNFPRVSTDGYTNSIDSNYSEAPYSCSGCVPGESACLELLRTLVYFYRSSEDEFDLVLKQNRSVNRSDNHPVPSPGVKSVYHDMQAERDFEDSL